MKEKSETTCIPRVCPDLYTWVYMVRNLMTKNVSAVVLLTLVFFWGLNFWFQLTKSVLVI